MSGCQATDRGLVGSSLASWWSVDGRPVTVTAAATPLPAAGVPCPCLAVPLKPGAGFKTVSASILRARPGSLCLILQTFVRVFSVTELIGLQVVSSGKKQVEKYILTGPYLRGKV